MDENIITFSHLCSLTTLSVRKIFFFFLTFYTPLAFEWLANFSFLPLCIFYKLLTHFRLRIIAWFLQYLPSRFFLVNMLLLACCYHIHICGGQLICATNWTADCGKRFMSTCWGVNSLGRTYVSQSSMKLRMKDGIHVLSFLRCCSISSTPTCSPTAL